MKKTIFLSLILYNYLLVSAKLPAGNYVKKCKDIKYNKEDEILAGWCMDKNKDDVYTELHNVNDNTNQNIDVDSDGELCCKNNCEKICQSN